MEREEESMSRSRINIEGVEQAVAEITYKFTHPPFEPACIHEEPSDRPVNFVFLCAHDEGGDLDLSCDAYSTSPDDEGHVNEDIYTYQGRFCDSLETMAALIAGLKASLTKVGIEVWIDTECCSALTQ
jgi:hypothetical protein